jgi:hypothetical protein
MGITARGGVVTHRPCSRVTNPAGAESEKNLFAFTYITTLEDLLFGLISDKYIEIVQLAQREKYPALLKRKYEVFALGDAVMALSIRRTIPSCRPAM